MTAPLVIYVEDQNAERAMLKLNEILSNESLVAWLEAFVLPMLQKRTSARFGSEGDDASGKWLPLAPATIAIREAGGYGAGPINHRTGELESYISHAEADVTAFGEGVQLSYPADTGLEERLYDKLSVAQMGDQARTGRPGTPARPVIAISEFDLRETEISLMTQILTSMGAIL
jgi:hypothetical protein